MAHKLVTTDGVTHPTQLGTFWRLAVCCITGTALTFEQSDDDGQSWTDIPFMTLSDGENKAIQGDSDMEMIRCKNPQAGDEVDLVA